MSPFLPLCKCDLVAPSHKSRLSFQVAPVLHKIRVNCLQINEFKKNIQIRAKCFFFNWYSIHLNFSFQKYCRSRADIHLKYPSDKIESVSFQSKFWHHIYKSKRKNEGFSLFEETIQNVIWVKVNLFYNQQLKLDWPIANKITFYSTQTSRFIEFSIWLKSTVRFTYTNRISPWIRVGLFYRFDIVKESSQLKLIKIQSDSRVFVIDSDALIFHSSIRNMPIHIITFSLNFKS